MTITKQSLITAEQYRTMPEPEDGAKLELVRGKLVPIPRPGFRHGLRQGQVAFMLDNYGRTSGHGRAVVETGFVTERDPDTVRGPDVSYWSAERLPFDQVPEGYPDVAPNVAVEVLSPHDCFEEILAIMREYFARGVRLVWIVDPEDRTVTVYRSPDEGRVLHEQATLTGEDVLPRFSCGVAELFQ